ncbi:MAG TPA: hypothetical protein VM305_09755 [Candidatus Limnocylindrales bacterium]|nr:hypothetical protein [Candidatus Limnocylindrales bacterium]
MDERAGALGEIASDAAVERSSFLADAGEQLKRFIEANRRHIKDVGGMVLIDDDPDYLSVAPDGTFRSRTRYQDDATGEWYSETEVIESAAELVELYNPAEIYAAFAEAARDEAGVPGAIAASEDLVDAPSLAPGDEMAEGYAGAADEWAANRPAEGEPASAEEAARRLYDLALTFQERSQHAEARLVEQFEVAAADLASHLGDLMILDDEDERLWFRQNGSFEAEVVPQPDDEREATDEWRSLTSPDELVEFYDPTDVFGDLAEALAEQFPSIAADDEEGEPA